MFKDQKGAVDIYLVIALVLVIVVGAFAFNRIQEADETVSEGEANSDSSVVISENNEEPEPKRSDNWKSVTSGNGGYTFSVPNGWDLLGGSDVDLVFSTLTLSYSDDTQGSLELLEAYGTDATLPLLMNLGDPISGSSEGDKRTEFEIDGIKGTKDTFIFPKDRVCEGLCGFVPGSTKYTYKVIVGEKEFRTTYQLIDGDVSELDILEEMISTVQFN